jgi:hypothetical protein
MSGLRAGGLTADQSSILDRLQRQWDDLAVPTVAHVRTPEYRGKTHIVHSLFRALVEADGAGMGGQKPTWKEAHDWRSSRHAVAGPVPELNDELHWLWVGARALPGSAADLLAPMRIFTRRLLTQATERQLPEVIRQNLAPSSEDWMGLFARSAAKISLEQIPQVGAGTAVVSGLRDATSLWRRRTRPEQVLENAAGSSVSEDFLAMLLAARLTFRLGTQPSLPKILMVIEEAQLLTNSDLTLLQELIEANPDDLLQEQLFPQSVVRQLRRLGVPPSVPLMIVLLEDTDAGGEPILGPFGELVPRGNVKETSVTNWVDRLPQLKQSVDVLSLRDCLPLFDEAEAAEVAAIHSPGLPERIRHLIVQRSYDVLLGGYNPALLRAHSSRVNALTDPDRDVDVRWCEKHLPQHLKAEIEERASRLPLESRQALIAASLLGHGFVGSSVDQFLNANSEGAMVAAGVAGLIHGEQFGTGVHYAFDDSMTYGYFREQAVGDPSLCRMVLNGPSVEKARWLLNCAYPSISPQARKISELARQSLWEYRDLAYTADLVSDARRNRDVWMGSLALSADLDMVHRELRDRNAEERLEELHHLLDAVPIGEENIHAWAISRRWRVHRLTPGLLTFQSLFEVARQGGDCSNVTRCIPEAHQMAAESVSNFFEMFKGQPIGYFELQLLARLGPYVRRLPAQLRRRLIVELLRVSLLSVTAAHYVVSELWEDCNDDQRNMLTDILKGWALVSHGEMEARSYALLAIRNPREVPAEASQALVQALNAGMCDDGFRDFDINGSFVDGSAPIAYPWGGLRILIVMALVQIDGFISNVADRRFLENVLWEERDKHPSAVALLLAEFPAPQNRGRQRKMLEVQRTWTTSCLAGHCEQAGLPILPAAD